MCAKIRYKAEAATMEQRHGKRRKRDAVEDYTKDTSALFELEYGEKCQKNQVNNITNKTNEGKTMYVLG